MEQTSSANAHLIYQILEAGASGDVLPVGARGAVYRLIDDLRRCRLPNEHLGLAEGIAVAIHKLEWATRIGLDDDIGKARQELRTARDAWLEMPLPEALH